MHFASSKLAVRKKKLDQIINSESKHLRFKKIYNFDFTVNGVHHPPLLKSFELLADLLLPIELSLSECVFSHGDLCFNNILVDSYSSSFKLIDPRIPSSNSIVSENLFYLPAWYDTAKLNHSFTCLYDSIVNNLFSLNSCSEKDFDLSIFSPRKYELIVNLFNESFSENYAFDKLHILTSSLFFSMLPLHSESEEKMLAFAIMASTLLNYDSSLKNMGFIS